MLGLAAACSRDAPGVLLPGTVGQDTPSQPIPVITDALREHMRRAGIRLTKPKPWAPPKGLDRTSSPLADGQELDLDFEGLGAFTVVGETYAALGVIFYNADVIDTLLVSGWTAAYPPRSGSSVMIPDQDSYDPVVRVTTDVPVRSVGVYATSYFPVTLTCYDESGVAIGADSMDFTYLSYSDYFRGLVSGIYSNHHLQVAHAGIRSCGVGGNAKYYSLDDFEFNKVGQTAKVVLTSDRVVLRPVTLPGSVFNARSQLAGDTAGKRAGHPQYITAARSDSILLTVTLRDAAGHPVTGSVEMTARAVDGSGGHVHDYGDRPSGQFFQIGSNVGLGQGTADSVSIAVDTTGRAQLIYRSSGVSGTEVILARFGSGSGASTDSVALNIAIPGLVLLGATPNLHPFGETDTHPSNHWGTSDMNSELVELADELRSVADSLAALPPSERPGSFPTRLGVNDMSLSQGGLFDFVDAWTNPHLTHRAGTDADVDVRQGADWDFYYKPVKRVWVDEMGHWLANERASANHVHLGY